MRFHPGLGVGFAFALTLVLPGACNGNGNDSGDDGGELDSTVESGDDAAEPLICTEFTEAGAPCPTPSPVRCFPECEAGGCFCTATPQGPRWTCESDLSCLADCAPLDDGCGAPISDNDAASDDGGGDDEPSDAAAGDGPADAVGGDGPVDAAGADVAGDGATDAGASDAIGASG